MLQYYISDDYEWEVIYFEDVLTGGTNESDRVIEETINKIRSEKWDYAITLTDLPLFNKNRPIVAEVVCDDNVGLISLPGLGLVPMQKRVREAILQLMNEIYYGISDEDRDRAQTRLDTQNNRNYSSLKKKGPKKLLGKRIFEIVSPLERQVLDDDSTDVDVRYSVKSKLNGIIRLVSGMVYANRPWEVFPVFFKIIVVAFTTGSYALIFPSIAKLSEIYSITRLVLITLVALLALVAWIILAHGLWQKKNIREEGHIRRIYNISTFFTLLTTVIMYYGILYVMFLTTTALLVPPSKLEADLSGTNDVSFVNYLIMAWTVTTFATIIGAIGSVFEDKEVILNSTYGYRQRQRHEKVKEMEKEEEEKKEKGEENREESDN
ncbi:hypothetical protein FO441_10110 [Salinicoccus cyprini]|uniref:5,10-methylene-tetrahydrofolate dehydrogenase n=2 Tax=Salinicoccus cyprini TaxID=2493691 RepID=A0A558AT42_9STAP|nr:hypothetical protein FO441_10110 [Salinicoccus cyprini]